MRFETGLYLVKYVIRPQQKTKLVAKHNFETLFFCKHFSFASVGILSNWMLIFGFLVLCFGQAGPYTKLINQGLTPTLHPFGLASTLVFLHLVLIGSLETSQSAFTLCSQGHLGWKLC